MDDVIARAIEAGEMSIARQKTLSKQPPSTEGLFSSVIQRMCKLVPDLQIPDYSSDSRRRDAWLQEFWAREPHWAGVINQMVMLNAGRGWSLVGGRNQVARYSKILHEADNGAGWRFYLKRQALSFYTTDMNAITELGRTSAGGPLRALFHVDPARCKLTGNQDAPLQYYPRNGKLQKWGPDDFFRVSTNPSPLEGYHGLGLCATSLAFELIKLLYAIVMHNQEQLGARMPEGILLMNGVSEQQWHTMIESRKAELDADLRRYFGGLLTFFDDGLVQMDANLVSLSRLPAGFDQKEYTDLLLYGYALILGMDPSEFWPVQFGSLGRGRETEVQHSKAMTKGASEFAITYQEQLQKELPTALQFEFDQRDDEGELLSAQVSQAWSDVAATLYESGGRVGSPLLMRQQALSLLVEHQIIPPEWSEIEEEDVISDTEARVLVDKYPRVLRACQAFPDAPLVRYSWPMGKMEVLLERGGDALPRGWRVTRQIEDVEEPDWSGDEAAIAAVVALVFDEFRPRFAESLARQDEPDYDGLSAALLSALVPVLASIAENQMLESAAAIQVEFDPATSAGMALTWAQTYAVSLVAGLVDTTRDVVSRIQEMGLTEQEEFDQELERAFGGVRAGAIAVTESTRAHSAGVFEYVLLAAGVGLILDEFWYTRRDEAVCPICRPLHKKPREVWQAEFPDGPPAHVRCRCFPVLLPRLGI